MIWNGKPRNFYAQGRLKTGEMNATERRYSAHLERLKMAGDVIWWKFEGIKLRLADNTFYTPDFAVLPVDMVMELHEIKTFWADDARVKIKVAADLYPFRFKAFKALAAKHGGGYEIEDFSGIPSEAQPALPLPVETAQRDGLPW